MCASHQRHKDPWRLMAVDVRRATFYAPATKPIFIHILAEDRTPEDAGKVARLNLSFYGTREAAQNSANTLTHFLSQCGFTTGRASLCNFCYAERDMVLTVHGDDFTVSGSTANLQWMKGDFERASLRGDGSHPRSRGRAGARGAHPEPRDSMDHGGPRIRTRSEVILDCHPRAGAGGRRSGDDSRHQGGAASGRRPTGRQQILTSPGGASDAARRGRAIPRDRGPAKFPGPGQGRPAVRLQGSQPADGDAAAH